MGVCVSLCQVFVGTFFVFRNSVEKLCVSWVQSFSTELLESKRIGSEHLSQPNYSKLNFVKTSIEFFQTRQLFFLIFRFMVALLASSFLFYATLY